MDGTKKKDGFVRVASQNRPGRFYLFNKATGESQWLPSEAEDEKNKHDSPPRLSGKNFSKTPAQDRLKRLQRSLKLSQTTPRASNPKPKSLKEQENELDDKSSTSCFSKSVANLPKKGANRSNSSSLQSGGVDSVKCVKYSAKQTLKNIPVPDPKSLKEQENELGGPSTSFSKSVTNSPKKGTIKSSSNSLHSESGGSVKCVENLAKQTLKNVPIPDSPSGNSKDAKNEPFTVDVSEVDSSISDQNLQHNSKLSSICSGIVRKIKKICKTPFNTSQKISDGKLQSKTAEDSLGLANTTIFKTTSRTKSKQILSTSITNHAIIKQIKNESKRSPENTTFTCSHSKRTPKSQNITSCTKGTANSRLERLQQHLRLQQQQQSSITKCSSDTTIALETNNNSVLSPQLDSIEPANTGNKSENDEVEGMDWQPITREENSSSDATKYQSNLVVEKSTKFLLADVHDDQNTIGDIIDTVNANLLRLSAEKQKDTNKNDGKWRKDFYYFVVDTNILLQDLTFIETLTKMKLCDTKGSLVYVPYLVLQELDKLKMRRGCQEAPKTRAVRAIKYLNSKLETNSTHVQAQSAKEERIHLIEVNSADDSIINCCLQVKDCVPNFLFLSEDVNLRNKAISNDIMVSTKSDLLAKRYNSSLIF